MPRSVVGLLPQPAPPLPRLQDLFTGYSARRDRQRR